LLLIPLSGRHFLLRHTSARVRVKVEVLGERIRGRRNAPKLEKTQSLLVVSVDEEFDLVGKQGRRINAVLDKSLCHGFGHEGLAIRRRGGSSGLGLSLCVKV
jgi:hypothetical protein